MSMRVKATVKLHLRAGGATSYNSLAILQRGETVTLLSDPDAVGRTWQWCEVRRGDDTKGFSAAWYLVLVEEPPPHAPPSLPDDYPQPGTWQAALRAPSFYDEPRFVCLPVELSKISAFAGFGRINFAHWLWEYGDPKQRDLYKYAGWAHPALDFFVPEGTPVRAMDYGVVMSATDAGSGNPYAAGPKSIIIRYGRYMTLYGHCSETHVTPGQVVGPGDVLGLSGVFNSPHLHLEIRRMPDDYVRHIYEVTNDAVADDILRTANERVELRGSWMYPGMGVLFDNPAQFFTKRLESYRFPHAAVNGGIDKDGNGYVDPDDLHSVQTLEYYGPSVWD